MNGVTKYDAGKAFNGYTLFCETFKHSKAKTEKARPVYLINMEGEPVHTWHVETSLQSYCRLLPNGNLIHPTHDRSEVGRGIVGLYELTPDSKVAWSYRCRVDHDFQILGNGNLLINTINETMCPALGPELKRHPYLVEVTRDKELAWEWRGEDHLEELKQLLSPEGWMHVLNRAHNEFAFDWAHNNTCQVIGPNATYEKEKTSREKAKFKPGNVFISYRSNDVIAVIEKESGRIVWAWGPGVLDGQHKPHMLENGNILIFDNGTLRGRSRVIEYNPLAGRIEWEYTGESEDPFFSNCISGAQRLPNGNTLICEGCNSRLFEVTADKEIVWEFINPYQHESAWHAIYRCLRYAPDFVAPLFQRREGMN